MKNLLKRLYNYRLLLLATIIVAGCGLTYWIVNLPSGIDEAARQAGELLARNGRNNILSCMICHGANGEGNFDAGFPRLAGLHPGYIAKQLQDFARDPMQTGVKLEPISRDYNKTPRIYSDLTVFTPGTRKDATMNGIAKALTPTDIQNLAIYFGSLPFETTPQPVVFQTLERGADLALRGKPEYGMPSCISCHGPDGRGFGPHFPPLAGQPPQYIINQINKWQTGDRDNDNLALMQNIANQLTDGDKMNAAAYFSNRSLSVKRKSINAISSVYDIFQFGVCLLCQYWTNARHVDGVGSARSTPKFGNASFKFTHQFDNRARGQSGGIFCTTIEDIPENKYGELVKIGRNIFVNTQVYGKRYVGNGLNCSHCHLSEGRKANAAPLWGAYGIYPMYRIKNREVVTFQERIQDCFKYSLDGIAPTVDSPEVEALTAYAHWLSTGVPVGIVLPGRGFTAVNRSRTPSTENGEIIYKTQCAMCHGEDGLGYKHEDGSPGYMFPPLWGPDSFNRAAGMNKVKTAAQFIKANMPLGKGFTLTDNEAADVAFYMWIQSRPYDPRRSLIINIFMPPPGGGG